MRKLVIIAVALIVLLAAFAALRQGGQERGEGRFFADTTYNFEAVRALNEVAPVGGDSADVQRAVNEIKPGDAESWFLAWSGAGERALRVAAKAQDPRSKATPCCARRDCACRPTGRSRTRRCSISFSARTINPETSC